MSRAALRFLYVTTLKQKWFEEEIPPPKRRPPLPTVLSAEEITRMLDLTTNLKHWTIMAVFYGTGLRANELCLLKVSDIDSQRMVRHVGRRSSIRQGHCELGRFPGTAQGFEECGRNLQARYGEPLALHLTLTASSDNGMCNVEHRLSQQNAPARQF